VEGIIAYGYIPLNLPYHPNPAKWPWVKDDAEDFIQTMFHFAALSNRYLTIISRKCRPSAQSMMKGACVGFNAAGNSCLPKNL